MGNIERCSDGRIVRRGAYPELTWTAVIVGYFLGAIITLSVGYAALILGFGIRGSDLAAILGFGILRGIMRQSLLEHGTIREQRIKLPDLSGFEKAVLINCMMDLDKGFQVMIRDIKY